MKITKSKIRQIIKEEIKNVNEIDIFGTQKMRHGVALRQCEEKLKTTQQAALKALKTIQNRVEGGNLRNLIDGIVGTFERDHGPNPFSQSDADYARTGEDTYRAPK